MTQKALRFALEALDNLMYWDNGKPEYDEARDAITAIKEALANVATKDTSKERVDEMQKQRHEPVATVESVATVVSESGNQEVTMSWWHEPALPVGTKLYTTPPQTDEFKCPLCYDDIANIKNPSQPEQEPVTWGVDWGKAGDIPCVSIIKRLPDGGIQVLAVEYAPYSYTIPPQRTWVGLTNNDLQPIAEEYRILFGSWVHDFARAIEAKLKEKNT